MMQQLECDECGGPAAYLEDTSANKITGRLICISCAAKDGLI